MTTQKTFIMAVVAMVLVGLLVSPALAHRKYRPHHKGLPRQVLVRHSHDTGEPVKSATSKRSDAEKFDLLGGAFDVVAGAFKAVGNTVEIVFGGKEKAAK